MKLNLDFLGIFTSLACAIHCALLPLFLTSLPIFGINIIDNIYFENTMVGIAFIVGILALRHGKRKHHHSLLPILIFSMGILFLFAKVIWHEYQYWLLFPAVSLIVTAHLLNFGFCRIHNHAHEDDCNH